MSSRLHKEWISSASNIDSGAYRKGICEFIQFIIEKGGSKKYYSCPCRKCHNASGQYDVEYITLHLLKNGMDEKYTLWYFHGEDGVVNQTQNEPEHVMPIDTTEEVNEYNSSTPNPTVNDVYDGGHESRDTFEAFGTTTESVKKLKFNDHGFAIGPGSEKAATKLGKLVKTHIPISFRTWHKVDKSRKEALWAEIKKEYNFTDAQKVVQLRKASEAWKKYKGKLRKLLKGNDIQKWLEAIPEKKVRLDDWEIFCQNEADSKQIALRERNKRIKNEFGKKSTHNTGRLGYARAEEKFRKENNGRTPMHVELWLYTHKTKEGGYATHDEELARKFEALLAIMRQNNEVETLDSGPIFDMFGVDKRRRVRCVGSTISRKALLASAFARQLLEEVDIERDEWREKLNSLEESNEKILAQMNELVEGLRSGKYNHFPNQSTPSNEVNNASNNDFGSSSYSHAAVLPCAIMSHTGKIVAYGTKIPVGTDRTVSGHVMQPREAKVLIDEVKDRSYAVWGGEQDGAKTLGDMKLGSFLYWHDDLLTPTDDY